MAGVRKLNLVAWEYPKYFFLRLDHLYANFFFFFFFDKGRNVKNHQHMTKCTDLFGTCFHFLFWFRDFF